MTDSNGVSGTVARPTKQSDASHPHYFTSFQNYCCGPKATATSASSTKDFLPIPEKFKIKGDDILTIVNRLLVERLPDLTQYTSVLPFEFFQQDRVPDAQRYLVDRIMVKMMNETRIINWMPSLKKLYPVRTSGNGNCLLHAVLIAMFGVHDFNLNLRDRLLLFMDKNKELLKGSWKAERLKTDKIYGIQSEESKLDSEWVELCDLVRYENSDDGQATSNLQFLEGVHIFSVSNMLARPIIILSEDVVRNKHGEAISYNDLFGIYLPILSRPQECEPTPIVLAYDQSHFCPLQATDQDSGSSSDNYLPLYQSIDHVQKQTLLPIRFLGNEGSPEQIDKLLNSYLRIKTLSHYPESNSVPIPVRCAELGGKHLADKHNFFIVYYEYLIDFFETQKRKLQQQEEEERRRRPYDDYHTNGSAYETSQRPLAKITASSSPPPAYSSVVTTRPNENKSNPLYERRSSYDKALANGTAYTSNNDDNRPINHYPVSQQQTQSPGRYVLANDPKKQYTTYRSDWNSNEDDRTTTIRPSNTSSTTSRGSDSKLKQDSTRQSTSIAIPVQFRNSDSPSNLIDFEQKTDRIRMCLLCKQNFKDLLYTNVCSKCDYDMKYRLASPPRYVVTTRAPPTYAYSTTPRNSDFITYPTSLSRSRGHEKVTCPHCGNINVVDSTRTGTGYTCSICRGNLYRPL